MQGLPKKESTWEEDEMKNIEQVFKLNTANRKQTGGHFRWSHPSAPSWGSFINWRNSAWCCWINLRRLGFCLPSSWSIGCNNITVEKINPECDQPNKRSPRNKIQTCNICGFAWTNERRVWNYKAQENISNLEHKNYIKEQISTIRTSKNVKYVLSTKLFSCFLLFIFIFNFSNVMHCSLLENFPFWTVKVRQSTTSGRQPTYHTT